MLDRVRCFSMHPLDAVEKRLRCTFPASFRDTYAGENVLTGIESWEIHTPDEMLRTTPNDDEGGFPDGNGVGIGYDIGGNRLLLRFGPDDKTLLEPLFCWDHETREVKEVAKDLATFFVEEDKEEEEELPEQDVGRRERVCKFCGSATSELVCSVCNRSADEPPDPKSSEIRSTFAQATAIVRRLVDDERLELVSTTGPSFARVVEVTSAAMEEEGGDRVEPSVIAEALLEAWENDPQVAEVFIDEFDLSAVVYAVRADS